MFSLKESWNEKLLSSIPPISPVVNVFSVYLFDTDLYYNTQTESPLPDPQLQNFEMRMQNNNNKNNSYTGTILFFQHILKINLKICHIYIQYY